MASFFILTHLHPKLDPDRLNERKTARIGIMYYFTIFSGSSLAPALNLNKSADLGFGARKRRTDRANRIDCSHVVR